MKGEIEKSTTSTYIHISQSQRERERENIERRSTIRKQKTRKNRDEQESVYKISVPLSSIYEPAINIRRAQRFLKSSGITLQDGR